MHGVPGLVSSGGEDRFAAAGVLGACRKSRRARQERRRRATALEECREDERERKRASRAAARRTASEATCPREQPPAAGPGPTAAPAPEVVSLTDLRGEVLEKIEETLKSWDARERVSLAGLRRPVVGILGHFLGNAGRAGPVRPGCP